MKPVPECTETVCNPANDRFLVTIGKPKTVPIMTRTLIFRHFMFTQRLTSDYPNFAVAQYYHVIKAVVPQIQAFVLDGERS